jgi:hypothetical protein
MDSYIGALVAEGNRSEAPAPNRRSCEHFAALIDAAWRKGAEAFMEIGRHLIEAKEELDRDEYDALVKKLAFDASVAKKLVCIASNQLLGAHVHQLPPC